MNNENTKKGKMNTENSKAKSDSILSSIGKFGLAFYSLLFIVAGVGLITYSVLARSKLKNVNIMDGTIMSIRSEKNISYSNNSYREYYKYYATIQVVDPMTGSVNTQANVYVGTRGYQVGDTIKVDVDPNGTIRKPPPSKMFYTILIILGGILLGIGVLEGFCFFNKRCKNSVSELFGIMTIADIGSTTSFLPIMLFK